VALFVPQPLAGEAKLRAALAAFAPAVAGRVAMDVGASAGGFTRVLLDAGASRLRGRRRLRPAARSLRQDARQNLERTNLRARRRRRPRRVELVTIVSYIALARAVPQL
jgi:predicted rRNA methylase YqxC with S4 and FtsJ domains